jgi:precorrin-3B synthase
MNASFRRGACPGLSAPMPTGDGLLVRILPKDRITPDAFIALCTAARAHGNGIVEISARGSVQVRGLTPQSTLLFASQVAILEIAQTCGVAVIADPIPDDPDALIDVGAVASTVRAAIEAAGFVLAHKVSVVVDGGGRLHLDALSADVRLRAFGPAAAARLHVALGGDACSATPLGAIVPDKAAGVVVRLLGTIAAHGRSARAADILRSESIDCLRATVADDIEAAPTLPTRAPVDPIGKHRIGHGRVALGIALAFGQADAEALAQLARIGADYGAHSLRAAPGRALLLSGPDEDGAAALAASAGRLGFVVQPDDPRRRIAACPGRPACASGWIAARALAAEVARHLPPHAGEIDVHISGCAKGCAHPAPAAVTVVGSERGCGIVHRGSARMAPRRYVNAESLVAEIARAIARSKAVHG